MRKEFSIRTEGLPERFAIATSAFVQSELPLSSSGDRPTLPEAIVDRMLGSRKQRQSIPVPEGSKGSMRSLVERHVKEESPIPVLVPMGPKKPIMDEGVDLAEVAMLKTLNSQAETVRQVYSPGVEYFFRFEDVTGLYLEGGEPGIERTMESYGRGLDSLIRVLGHNDFMSVVRESALVRPEDFCDESRGYAPLLSAYIADSDRAGIDNASELDSFKALQEVGWQGAVPAEQRQFYRDRYSKLYPERDSSQIDGMMTTYLASTLARYKLGVNAPPEIADGHFQLNFAPPVPGTPTGLTSTRMYYRVLPTDVTRMHIAFWRAKGVMKEHNSSEIKPTLVPWGSSDEQASHTGNITIFDSQDLVNVQADYLSAN